MMIQFLRAAALPLLVLSALSACGDDDAAQRKAFIAFLQTRIVDKPGIHVPHPTADESKAWGSYASQYAIITGFNDALSEHVTAPTSRAVSRGAVTSLQDLIARRSDLAGMFGAAWPSPCRAPRWWCQTLRCNAI